MKKTILLLEDDKNLNRGITMRLEKEGYHVLSAFGVSQAEELMEQNMVQLIISDITLEDGNGIDFCCRLRKTSGVHLIFLTALDQEMDIVNGYDAGADDYMTKPVNYEELIWRLDALLRRAHIASEHRIVVGRTVLDSGTYTVTREGAAMELPKKEFGLL